MPFFCQAEKRQNYQPCGRHEIANYGEYFDRPVFYDERHGQIHRHHVNTDCQYHRHRDDYTDALNTRFRHYPLNSFLHTDLFCFPFSLRRNIYHVSERFS